MASGTLLFSTVPSGQDQSANHIVTVHVAPRLLASDSPALMKNWASDVKAGSISFKLMSDTGEVPASLDTGLISPDVYRDFFAETFGDKSARSVAAPFKQPGGLNIRRSKVNLRDALNRGNDFYHKFTPKVDVTDATSLSNLVTHTTNLVIQNSLFAPPGSSDPGDPVRVFLADKIGKNLPVTRIFGHINPKAAFPDSGNSLYMSKTAADELDHLHSGNNLDKTANRAESKNDPSKRQHVVHHVHRLRSASRQSPADITLSSLHATSKASGLLKAGSQPLNSSMSFADRVALIQGMPALMETLGLVLVFKISSTVDLSAVKTLAVRLIVNGTSVVACGSDVCYETLTAITPWTATDHSLFLPLPAPLGGSRALNPVIRADNGYIDTSNDYEMGCLQLESASSHAFNFANRAAYRLHHQGDRGAVTQQHSEDYTHVVLPHSPHTDGMYVYQHERQTKISDKLTQQVPPTNSSTFYAEDLFHSMAVDMMPLPTAATGKFKAKTNSPPAASSWVSLTARSEQYFHQPGFDHPITSEARWEHGVRTSATRPTESIPGMKGHDADQAGKYQIDETLFTWRRGSLALKDTSSEHINSYTHGKLSTQSIPWTDKYHGRFGLPNDLKIPEQRFGVTYSFALRPVYLTGRSRPFIASAAAAAAIPNPTPLLRNEMVLGPKLIKRSGTGSKHGDTQTLMFVSSQVRDSQDVLLGPNRMGKIKISKVIDRSVRYLVPGATTAAVARRHGMPEKGIVSGNLISI